MIGSYAIRNRIGRGAMGVVYRAVDERTNSVVALKAMASDLDGDPETRERFFREALVAGKLRHRNIVTVVDSGEDNGRLYIAMELLSGVTLNERIKDSTDMELEDRIDVMIQVCQGLQVAHAAGVFHRDLKPANLFVCEDRRVKILDFGVARLVGSNMTVTGNIIGTPDFMSPEQVRGRDVDERSDIFSAASVFYLLLTGRKPFAASDLPAVLSKVARAQPLPIREDEAPEPIAAVIRKAMSKDPEARQQNIRQLAAELMAASSIVEAGTRRRAVEVRRLADQIIQLTKRHAELSARLEVADGDDRWLALCQHFPILQRGSAVLGTYPLRSSTVNSLDAAFKQTLDSLSPSLSAREVACAECRAGETLMADGAFDAASAHFEAARRAIAASPVIDRAIDACAQALDERREREALLQSRLALAGETVVRADWPALLAIVKEIQDVDPANVIAERLRVQASANLSPEQARTARKGSGPGALPPVATTMDVDATLPVGGGKTQTPPSGGDANKPRLSESERTGARAERLSHAERLRSDAERQFAAGDFSAAERSASQSVALNGEDAAARHLLERIRAAVILQESKEEKSRRVADLMQRASGFANQKNYGKALALVDDALAVDATHSIAAAMRARLAAECTAHEAEQHAEAARQQRIRAAAPVLSQAQRAFRDRDLERARWYAENAIALSPDSPEALTLLAEITAAMPAPTNDDTVQLADPATETAEMAPLGVSMQDRMNEVRARVSDWFRRWGVSHFKDR